jgi:general secretion pathway protein G
MQHILERAQRRRLEAESGLTLIELLAIIIILAIIAAVAVPVVLNSINNAKVNTTKQSMSVVVEALNRYAAENNGQFPNSSQTLNALVPNYLQAVPNDAWGNAFSYTSNGASFTLSTSSAGHNITFSSNMTSPQGQ